MEKVKEITREVEPSVPICDYCKQLVAEPCKTDIEYLDCGNETINFNSNNDFDPQLN